LEKSKIHKKRPESEGVEYSVVGAAACSKQALKFLAAGYAVQAVLKEYTNNLDFYHELIKFNIFNGTPGEKVYEYVAFHDLPPEIDKIAARIYCKLADIPMAQIYDKLNITSSSTNRVSPIETKWVYHYIKKYKTTKFHSANTIDDLTLLAPLTDQQRVEYQRMKF
jgi:hypothetical protein